MDTNFQTSFIPKKPLAEERVPAPAHTSIFSFIATLIFFASIACAAGVYFYKASLVNNIMSMNSQLNLASQAFEPTLITQLQTLDRRITDANLLLSNHIAVTPIFAALQADTLKTIQFTKFTYTTPTDPTAPITVNMSGRAKDYASIALESDQLATNKDIHNSIFSNLALEQQTGTVTFDLVFTVDPELVRFTDHIDDLTGETTASATPTSITAPGAPAVPAQGSAPLVPVATPQAGSTTGGQTSGAATGTATPVPQSQPTIGGQ